MCDHMFVMPEEGHVSPARLRIDRGGRRLQVGRSPESDLVIRAAGASRNHAEFVWPVDWEAPLIVDLESTNGVFRNGQRINIMQSLEAGDTVRIGAAILRVWPGTS